MWDGRRQREVLSRQRTPVEDPEVGMCVVAFLETSAAGTTGVWSEEPRVHVFQENGSGVLADGSWW